MNAATAHTTESDTMSNGKHLDISPRTFVDRCSALGFERKLTHDGDAFIHHGERIIVAPVRTELGSIDRWHTVRRLEESLHTHRARRRGQRAITLVALVMLALFVGMAWPLLVRAETKQGAIERAYDDVESVAPLATCSRYYVLMPRETATFECFHNLVGITPMERLRSGNGVVLISPARSFSKPPGVLVTITNTSDTKQSGTATVEFW